MQIGAAQHGPEGNMKHKTTFDKGTKKAYEVGKNDDI